MAFLEFFSSNGVGCPRLFSRLRRILSMVPQRGFASASYYFICGLFHLFAGGSATTYQAPVFSKEGPAADHNVACGYLCFSISAELGKPAGARQTVVPAGSSDKSLPNISQGKVQKRSDVARTMKGQLTSQRQYCAEEKAKTVSSPTPWRFFSCWHAFSHEMERDRVTFLLCCLQHEADLTALLKLANNENAALQQQNNFLQMQIQQQQQAMMQQQQHIQALQAHV